MTPTQKTYSHKQVIVIVVLVVVFFLSLIVAIAYPSYKAYKEKNVVIEPGLNPYADSLVEATLYQNEDLTWGYDILIDGNIYVHQSTKPAVGGNSGFATEIEAQQVADLVISKIKNNVLPPSVTPEEIKELGA
jgi:hypothetical protein